MFHENDVILAGHAHWMHILRAKTPRIRRQNKPDEPSRFASSPPLFAALLNILLFYVEQGSRIN